MLVLKKYIIKEWYRSFMGATLVLFLLITVANLISGFLRSNVTPVDVIFNHLIELPGYFNMIFPIACLVASLFSINKLKNRNELTAIFASGFSRRDFMITLIQASTFVALIQFATSAYISPFAKSNRHKLIEDSGIKFRNLKSQGLRSSTIGSGKIWYKGDDYFFSFLSYDKDSKTLSKVAFYRVDSTHKIKKWITAEKLMYQSDNNWLGSDVMTYDFLNNKTFPTYSKSKDVILNLKETPKDFKQIEADITTLNIRKLFLYIKQLNNAGININKYLVLFLDKFSSSLICIILALIAAVTAFDPNRRNSSFGKNVVFIFIFTIIYWFIYSYFIQLGQNSIINPYLACFAVPILFGLFLVFFFAKNRKLS
jgi:lipopolysaccharide export system permease protein